MLAQLDKLPDVRLREIATEALQWALDNAENFSTHLRDKINRYGHSPNFVAFTNLLDGLDHTSKRWGRKIREIVHDEQSQFGKTITQWHATISQPSLVHVEPLKWPGEDVDISVSKVPGSAFRMTSEENSAGLQVVDVVLWLLKRMFDGKDFGQESAVLVNWVLKRAYQNDFTFAGVAQNAEDNLRPIMEATFSKEQWEKGAAFRAEEEASRQKQIEAYAQEKLGRAIPGAND